MYNIYNQYGNVTITITVEPSCSDAAGCGPKLMIYAGSSLSGAQANFPLSGTWYNHRFLKVKASDRPVLTGTSTNAILYCG